MGYLSAGAEPGTDVNETTRSSRRVTADLVIDGMSCAACVSRVESALRALDDVDDASVNLATERARVSYRADRVSPDDLIEAVAGAGYSARGAAGHTEKAVEARRPTYAGACLLGAVALTVPVALISMIPALRFSGWGWVALALSAPVVLVAGWRFHRTALANVRRRAATMDTLVSMGTLAALLWSTVALVAIDGAHLYFEVGAVITTLILLGRYLERGARRRSNAAVRQLLELGAREARLLTGSSEHVVPIAALRPGDLFVVRPGERVATDGTVVDGASAIDTSMLTGEPRPVEAASDDDVTGGTLNTYGRLVVRATRVGSETALAQIARLVEEAQSGKAPVQRLADRVAAVFVPVVMTVALATLGAWLAITGDAGEAFTAAIAVLIVACPCALGLATPTALMVGTGRGAQLGILIRGPETLERSQSITTVAIDKTGTITEGSLELVDIELLNGAHRRDVLRLAGAVEHASEHPIGKAVVAEALGDVGELPAVTSFRAIAGVGVAGVVEGHRVEIRRDDDRVSVSWDGLSRARLTLRDTIKPTSAPAISKLRALSLDTVLLSGDSKPAAERTAHQVGIDRVVAEALPHEKAALIADLQEGGEIVAMVGDGINDAPALARADLGIALASGSDIAMESSDITLLSSDLHAVVDAIGLARRVLATIKENLFWAFAYNAVAIPLAVGGLLSPIAAAAAMAGSSLLVVGNSLRLKRFQSCRA